MKHLLPGTLIVFLLVLAGNRVWARRCLSLLSVQQKASVLDASAVGNVWPLVCLALSAAALFWLPRGTIPPGYGPGVFGTVVMVPFLVSVGAGISAAMRAARLDLPQPYLRSLRWRMLIFHLALLALISAIVHALFVAYRAAGH